MSSPAELECKKLCVRRCLFAVTFGIAIQYLLLSIFLLLVNFSLLHPIQWVTETFSLVFSVYTWLKITPLISALVLYGIFLGNSFLAVPKYYPSRFAWLCGTFLKKWVSFVLHALLGFLTAWLYAGFLSEEYNVLLRECYEGYCLNERYIFLALGGVYAGLYYFSKERFTGEPEIVFPVIQECKYVKIRSQIYSVIYMSLMKSFVPVMCFVLVYWVASWTVTSRVAAVFDAEPDESFSSLTSIMLSFRLLLYTWILASQILCNMYLLYICFIIVLTTEEHFLIEKGPALNPQEGVTIVEALSLSKVPIAQHLASLDLFNLATSKSSERRQQIFSLSVPGGHPYNWNQLSGQVLSMIDAFTDELTQSRKTAPIQSAYFQKKLPGPMPPATLEAERILIRQYNESFGIRNMMGSPPCRSPPPSCNMTSPAMNPCDRVSDTVEHIGQVINDACRSAFYNIPGFYYLFGEQEGAKTTFILARSQDIIWLTQALAGLCAASLTEDRFGVVQKELPVIIKSFLRLKAELDQICNMNLNGKKLDRNCIALRNAVKRSLYKICTVFGDYIGDLIADMDELRRVQCYVKYLET